MTTRNGALDLLRGLAIAAVLACHLANAFARGTTAANVASVGGEGVKLFFVLSGFLLGSQLFREREKTGTVNVRRFWARRWLRTLPAYYAVLFATFAQFVAQGKPGRIDWRYLVFLQNYIDPEPPFLGVTWSLCVEEHFYLVVGPAVWLAARWRGGAWLCLAAVAVLAVLHALGLYWPQDANGHTGVSQVAYEPCLVGVCVGWVAVCRPRAWEAAKRWSPVPAGLSLLVVGGSVLNRTVWEWWLPESTAEWAAVFAAWVMLANRSAWWENLHLRPVRFVADRAYSLYLVHTEAIAAAKKLTMLPEWGQAAVALGLSFALAEVLYRGVERPFMRVRGRVS